jgi:hypothetical protein
MLARLLRISLIVSLLPWIALFAVGFLLGRLIHACCCFLSELGQEPPGDDSYHQTRFPPPPP